MNKKIMKEMDEQYKNCPIHVKTHEVDGVQHKVISHFIGNRDINDVMHDYAYNRVVNEMLHRIPETA